MADKKKKKDSDAPEEEGGKKGSPIKKLLPIILALVIGGVGYKMGGSKEPETIIAEPVEVLPIEEIHEIVALDAMNVNLADGHYLRIAVSLGLGAAEESADAAAADAHSTTTTEEGPSIETAPAADLVLTTFSGLDIEHLQTPEGREEAREHLLVSLEEFYGEEILTVLFTEFVMQ